MMKENEYSSIINVLVNCNNSSNKKISNNTSNLISTINKINNKLNIKLTKLNTIKEYKDYLNVVLNSVKKPKYIPISWLDEREDLNRRLTRAREELERNKITIVKADGSGSDMPIQSGYINSTEQLHLRRIELEQEIIPRLETKLDKVNYKINLLDQEFDDTLKDYVKELIEFVPNETYKDVLLQFYIYKKTKTKIASDYYLSQETIKSYRFRGFSSLVDVIYTAMQKN